VFCSQRGIDYVASRDELDTLPGDLTQHEGMLGTLTIFFSNAQKKRKMKESEIIFFSNVSKSAL